MAKIHELNEQQTEILDRLFWLDENNAEDAAEIEKLKHDLLKIRGSAQQTLEFLSGLLLESRSILAGREETKKRAERRRKTAERSVERLTMVIERIMSQFKIDKIALADCDLRLQLSPGSLVYDVPLIVWEDLPKDCYSMLFKPNAEAIKAHLAAGEELPGVSLVKKENLRIL